jgi:hypothetical protein
MKVDQLRGATICDRTLREFAEILLGTIAGREEYPELLEDEELLDIIHGDIELAYSSGFQAAERSKG